MNIIKKGSFGQKSEVSVGCSAAAAASPSPEASNSY